MARTFENRSTVAYLLFATRCTGEHNHVFGCAIFRTMGGKMSSFWLRYSSVRQSSPKPTSGYARAMTTRATGENIKSRSSEYYLLLLPTPSLDVRPV